MPTLDEQMDELVDIEQAFQAVHGKQLMLLAHVIVKTVVLKTVVTALTATSKPDTAAYADALLKTTINKVYHDLAPAERNALIKHTNHLCARLNMAVDTLGAQRRAG